MAHKEDLMYLVALTMVPKIGSVLAKNLLAYCGSANAVFSKKHDHLLKIPGIGPKIAAQIIGFKNFQQAEKEVKFMEQYKIKPIFFLDKDYPQRLKDIPDAPFLLYFKGNTDLNVQRMIAIVGTRKATDYGRATTDRLTEELKSYNATIVSGLAYGIDYTAHRSSLKYGMPTIGVMATGLDTIYPAAHRNLVTSMLEQGGGIISEYPSGGLPDKDRFPERNRIVAGMTDAIIVVESPKKGGSLITAEIANSYNREVFAVPGRAGDEQSMGCNHYIKINKACLAEQASDIAYIMGWDTEQKPAKSRQMPLDLTETEKNIYELLKEKDKANIDNLSFTLGYSSSELSIILLDMEFKGLIQSLPGKVYRLN
jgi:DNA processing protein